MRAVKQLIADKSPISTLKNDLMILMIVPDDLFKISKSLIILQFLN